MMGTRTVDALQCFTYLTDNIPSWVTRVTDLASHTAAKHAEFAEEYTRISAAEKKPRRRRKNSSLKTNRDNDPAGSRKRPASELSSDEEQQGEQHQQQPKVGDSFADPLTLLRLSRHHPQDRQNNATASERAASQARHQVIVHYDSHTQNAFEMLVRDVGGARNNLRKGRMNHMMKNGLALRTNLLSSHQFNDGRRPVFRSTRMDYTKGDQQSGNLTAFDTADKELEAVQALCETGAHQFLRCGDCSTELAKIKGHLEAVLETARPEVERLRAEAKEDAEAPHKTLNETERETARPKVDKGPPEEVGTIEVDDASETSSVVIDIAAFRSSRFRV
ncbi:hypothetical protein VTO42DRAFT_4589 [Malbranchea cinnamomea]